MFSLNNKSILVFLIVISLILVSLYFAYVYYYTDFEFVKLIKEMAIKNHNNSSLFVEKYKEASTEEEQLKIILINNFYECVYNNTHNIKTKLDVNVYCGHFVKF